MKERAIKEEASHCQFLVKEALETIEKKINATLRKDLDAKHLVILNWRTSEYGSYYEDDDDVELETLFDNKIVFEHVQKELAKLGMEMRRIDIKYRKLFVFPRKKETILISWQK